MLVITGIFENERFIPDKPVSIPQRKKVTVIIDDEKPVELSVQERIAAAERLVGVASNNPMSLEEIRNERLARQ
jgi:ABC-type phosphate transport system ATPase subunit